MKSVSETGQTRTWKQENSKLDETPLIQQYLQFRSEFMGYLYAITRNAELSEEV